MFTFESFPRKKINKLFQVDKQYTANYTCSTICYELDNSCWLIKLYCDINFYIITKSLTHSSLSNGLSDYTQIVRPYS